MQILTLPVTVDLYMYVFSQDLSDINTNHFLTLTLWPPGGVAGRHGDSVKHFLQDQAESATETSHSFQRSISQKYLTRQKFQDW